MTQEQAIELVETIRLGHPRGADISRETMLIWATDIQPYDYEIARAAVGNVRRASEFLPTIAAIINEISRLSVSAPDWTEAWTIATGYALAYASWRRAVEHAELISVVAEPPPDGFEEQMKRLAKEVQESGESTGELYLSLADLARNQRRAAGDPAPPPPPLPPEPERPAEEIMRAIETVGGLRAILSEKESVIRGQFRAAYETIIETARRREGLRLRDVAIPRALTR